MESNKTAQMLKVGDSVYDVSIESIKELKVVCITIDSRGIVFSMGGVQSSGSDNIHNALTATKIEIAQRYSSYPMTVYTNHRKAEQVQLQLRKDKLIQLANKATDATCELNLFSSKYFK